MTKHAQVKIRVGDQEAEVDELLAPLLSDLWSLGIETLLSCQNNVPKNWVWIMFPAESATKFLNLVGHQFSCDKRSLYHKICTARSRHDPLGKYQKNWKIDLVVSEFNESFNTDEVFFYLDISVRFPRSDLRAIEEQVRQAVAGT